MMPKIEKPKTSGMNVNSSEPLENNESLKTHNDDDQRRKPVFLFSVDYILNKAGETNTEIDDDKQVGHHYDWLYCTRFKPPKLDRVKRKDGQHRQKRRSGRNPRIPFTVQQVTALEQEFQRSAYLGGTNDVHVLSEKLRLSENRIKIWFQNRRARERRDHNGLPASSNTSSPIQQQWFPISSTSAFKPLPPSCSFMGTKGPSSINQ